MNHGPQWRKHVRLDISKVKVKNDEVRFGGQLIDLETKTKRGKKEKWIKACQEAQLGKEIIRIGLKCMLDKLVLSNILILYSITLVKVVPVYWVPTISQAVCCFTYILFWPLNICDEIILSLFTEGIAICKEISNFPMVLRFDKRGN